MQLNAYLIMYYFIIATLSVQTAGAYAGPLNSMTLCQCYEKSCGHVFTLCCYILVYLNFSNQDTFLLIASMYKVVWHNCPSASACL